MNKLTEPQKEWLAALRSGEYRQGQGLLHNTDDDTYCCLGVACDLYNKKFPGVLEVTTGVNLLLGVKNAPLNKVNCRFFDQEECYPPNEVTFDWLDLPGLDVDEETLVHLNDVEERTFEEIADFIEKRFQGFD